MTDRKAFEAWDREIFALPDRYYTPLYQGDFPSIDVKARWKAWQAACAWQREADAKVCEELIRRQGTIGRQLAVKECADKIRSGG